MACLHIARVQTHKLRVAEGSGEAQQQERPVPHADEPVTKCIYHAAHLGGDGSGFAVLVRPFGAADALSDEPERDGARGGTVATSLVKLGDGSKGLACLDFT